MLKHIRKVKKEINLNVKVNPEEMATMLAQAKRYTDGNLSEWVRYAACQLKPPKSDLRD